MNNEQFLRDLMKQYITDNLVGISPEDFKAKIDEFLELEDWKMEGFQSPEMQREESVKFHWGHDHDFGDFKLKGKAGDRHIRVIDKFIDMGLPKDLVATKILDIGAWTGGTSLLLNAMGTAELNVLEEVKKYADVISFLSNSFRTNIWVPSQKRSLYDYCDARPHFSYILCAGVLYHLTDPVVALRIVFNSLRDGGKVFIETACINDMVPAFDYCGPHVPGWNWLIPTKGALLQMMIDVGFEDVEVEMVKGRRAYAVGTRKQYKDMLRAGLSRREIR